MPLTQEQVTLPFDMLTYPQDAFVDGVLVDVEDGAELEAAQVYYVGRGAVSAADEEVVAQYVKIAEQAGHRADQTMLISDRPGVAEAAVEVGMGVVQVDDAEAAQTSLDILLDPTSQTDEPLYEHRLYTDLSYKEIADALFKPGEVNVVGFVGRTGAGKSTTIRRLIDATQEIGGEGGLFEVDAFFVRSRADRKAWLNEAGISDEERADRQRVITWWDLGRTAVTLTRIRNGEHAHLEGLYDMRQGGEMVGVLDIDPGDKGYTVFVEGTALLVPEFDGVIDSFVFMNTHDKVRAALLMERNLRDGYTAQESHDRKALTDAAETGEHIAEPLRKARFVGGGLTVLDNTHRSQHLRLMPPYIPRK